MDVKTLEGGLIREVSSFQGHSLREVHMYTCVHLYRNFKSEKGAWLPTEKRGDRVDIKASRDVVSFSVKHIESRGSRGHKYQVSNCQYLLWSVVPVVYKLRPLGVHRKTITFTEF